MPEIRNGAAGRASRNEMGLRKRAAFKGIRRMSKSVICFRTTPSCRLCWLQSDFRFQV